MVWKFDRLGRNLAHLLHTVQDLAARGVGLRCSPVTGQTDTSLSALCTQLGIKPVTLYRYVGPQGQSREQDEKVLAT